MAVNFPTSLDNFTNPASNSSVANPSHAQQHADANDAIEALQAKVGVDNSEVVTSLDYRVKTLETQSVNPEDIQAIVGEMVSDNTETDLEVTYDAETGKLNFAIGSNVVTNESLGNTLTDPEEGYVPISDVGNPDGVASLDSDGKVPASELDIDGTIQSVASTMITSGNHTNLTIEYDEENKVLNFTSEAGGANVSISSNPPAEPTSGDLWLDSDTAILYAYDGSFWVEISGSGGGGGGGGGGGFTLSPTAPSPAVEGDTWFDTTNAKLYVFYDSYWVEAIASGATGPQGPMFLDYQGAWNSSVGYVENEGVTYNGTLWRLNVGNSPAGTPPSAPNWQLVVEKGATGEIDIGTVTTLTHGNPVTVTNSGTSTDAVFNFSIPAGPAATIAVGTVTSVTDGDPATVTNSGTTSDAVFDFEIPAATITIGDVVDVDFGTPATVTNVGTERDAIFDFELTTGRASTLAIGTVTTGNYANPATVENVGTVSDAVFNFTIPQGDPGEFNVSATAPANPVEGNVWYNSTNGRAYVYYDNYWVEYAMGPTGATGPKFLEYKGLWDSLEDEYVRYDGVTYNGSLWILNSATSETGEIPAEPAWTLVVEKGDKGDAAATVNVGTTTTLAPGNPASVTNSGNTSDAVFNFSIPSGPAATITVGTVEDVIYGNPPTVTNSGDTSEAVFDFEIPAGRAATVSVGTVTTVVDGNDAEVTNSGDTSDAVFDFTIPAGPRSTITIGDVTDIDFGNPPTVTNVGTTSDAIFDFELTTGRASTLAVGTVTTGSYSSQASVTNVGTTSDATFNFSIPQGIPGDFQPGETPPANPLAGHVWYNTNTGRAYVYHDSFWVEFSPGFVGPAGSDGTNGTNGTNGADGADGVDGANGADGQSWTPVEVSSNISLAKDNRYFVDTSAARTLTLPASPALNDEIQILDASGTASTYNITVARNGNKINGGTGNLIIDNNGGWYTLLYTGSTYGWKVG